MLLPAVSRRFAITLVAISQSALVIAQSAAPQEAGQPAGGVAPLRIPEVKLVEGAERTIMLADGTKIKVPEDLWKPRQLLNTSHGPVQLPGNLGEASSQQSGGSQPQVRKQVNDQDNRPGENRSDAPPKGERQRFRFEMPEPTPAQGNRDPASPAQEGSKALKQQPQPSSKSATTWKPRGIVSMRNQLQFSPAPDGTLRTGRNANIRGDNGEMAASSQTRAMRSIQGMPEHLRVYFDAKTNGFYIDVVRQ